MPHKMKDQQVPSTTNTPRPAGVAACHACHRGTMHAAFHRTHPGAHTHTHRMHTRAGHIDQVISHPQHPSGPGPRVRACPPAHLPLSILPPPGAHGRCRHTSSRVRACPPAHLTLSILPSHLSTTTTLPPAQADRCCLSHRCPAHPMHACPSAMHQPVMLHLPVCCKFSASRALLRCTLGRCYERSMRPCSGLCCCYDSYDPVCLIPAFIPVKIGNFDTAFFTAI